LTAVVLGDALFDPVSGETLRGGVAVVVEEGRVAAAGRRDRVRVPAGAERIDGEGLTLLPGLIDCHVHLRSKGTGRDLGEWLATPPSLWVLQTVAAARATLEAGFTTVRDAGGSPNGVRLAIERGLMAGPRTLLSITALSQTGGHTDLVFACGADIRPDVPDCPPGVVDGVEPMRRRVREVIRAGADWIKLCTSGGVLSPSDSPHHPTLTLDEIRAAVEEAAAQGRKVMAHAQATAGIRNALEGGVSTIEHGIWLDDDCCELMQPHDDSKSSWGPGFKAGPPLDHRIQRGCRRTLVPTLVAPLWVIRHAEAGRMPAWATEKAKAVFDDHKRSFQRALAAGVEIAFGTDTGVGPHGSMGEEFLLMRELGMDPLACLRSATTVAAQTIGYPGVGDLREGSWGDLIGVAGDPLEDLELVARPENVRLVVKGGEPVKGPRARRPPTAPAPPPAPPAP
jgi:imidazolonepropionase-like amidohydrolase